MSNKLLTAVQVIEKIMQEHNGQASLGLIYREYEKKWKDKCALRGKTPHASLRSEVQTQPKLFKRVGTGIYALVSVEIPLTKEPKTQKERRELRHADIQGMLLAIGNHREANTYTPDKNKLLHGTTPLSSIATLDSIPDFTYPQIVKSTRGVDVLWFNSRQFPTHAFEVEHSTDFRGALTKFCELQDFHVKFACVAEASREEKFKRELDRSAFAPIKDRCSFRTYEHIENIYNNIEGYKEFMGL